jgi:AcrR family transcriptional regulator
MAYEVTKRISGGDYRYHVEGYRDPETGRQRTRWQYLGRVVDGVTVTPPTRRGERVTQDKIVEATAELLESRDASRVTVAVIAKHAGISQATFYRYFRIFSWLESLHRSILRQRAFRWSFTNSDRSKAKAQIERSMLKVDGYAMLAAYLRRLDAAGIAHIEDAEQLAEAIFGVCRAVIRSQANEVEHEEEHPVELLAVFPLIERAVFCSQSRETS